MKSFMLLITYRLTFLCASADRYGFFRVSISLSRSFSSRDKEIDYLSFSSTLYCCYWYCYSELFTPLCNWCGGSLRLNSPHIYSRIQTLHFNLFIYLTLSCIVCMQCSQMHSTYASSPSLNMWTTHWGICKGTADQNNKSRMNTRTKTSHKQWNATLSYTFLPR